MTGKEGEEMKDLNGLEGLYLEDLEVGLAASYAKTVTETDIVMFAGLSGDTNPVHLNDEYARTTMFEGRIAHGMLSAGFISTLSIMLRATAPRAARLDVPAAV